eukprot:356925-Chlamydomonas_euryale.AAC.9
MMRHSSSLLPSRVFLFIRLCHSPTSLCPLRPLPLSQSPSPVPLPSPLPSPLPPCLPPSCPPSTHYPLLLPAPPLPLVPHFHPSFSAGLPGRGLRRRVSGRAARNRGAAGAVVLCRRRAVCAPARRLPAQEDAHARV